jgi:hypothetical protein
MLPLPLDFHERIFGRCPLRCSASLTLLGAPVQLVVAGGFQPLVVTSTLNCVTVLFHEVNRHWYIK